MESIFFIIISSGIGYAIHLIQSLDNRIDKLSERILRLEILIPKRNSDRHLLDDSE